MTVVQNPDRINEKSLLETIITVKVPIVEYKAFRSDN